jgi:hypothetical protein
LNDIENLGVDEVTLNVKSTQVRTALRLMLFEQYSQSIKRAIEEDDIKFSTFTYVKLNQLLSAFLLGTASERISGLYMLSLFSYSNIIMCVQSYRAYATL